MRPLIVGEAPGRGDGGPIEGRIGRRLARWCGLSDEEFASRFERVNVLSGWPGTDGKGARFPMAEAVASAPRLLLQFAPGRIVILLGHRVALAFGLVANYFIPVGVGEAVVVVVPHPSGVNKWFNDPANDERMRRFMAAIAEVA